MNISSIKNSIVSSGSAAANAFSNGASWAGHQVSTHFLPAVKNFISAVNAAAKSALNFTKTSPVRTLGIFGVATFFAGLGLAAFGCAAKNQEENEDATFKTNAWKAAGAVSMVAAGAFVVLGVAAIVA